MTEHPSRSAASALNPAASPAHLAGDTSTCRCCGAAARAFMMGTVLDLDVVYYECPMCEYVQTETPYWLDRAYAEVINHSDTGLVARNLVNHRIVIATLGLMDATDGRVVDCAGGYGLLVRLLRDSGVDAHWSDPYCENLMARGFEHGGGSVDLVTAFEAFEHFVEPATELERLLSMGDNLLLSTLLLPSPPPPHDEWWYYGKEHGQHVGFFRARTLSVLAQRHGKYFQTDGTSYHLITSRPVGQLAWKLCTRASKLLSPWISRKLRSRTWSDHVAAARG